LLVDDNTVCPSWYLPTFCLT